MEISEMAAAIEGGSADLRDVAENLLGKCKAEETEYQATMRASKRLRNVVFWCGIFCVLTIVALCNGAGGAVMGVVAGYFAILTAASIYAMVSMRSISRQTINEPSARTSMDLGAIECSPSQIEELFDYYWSVDKRNDKVSTTIAVTGTIMGIATVLLVVVLVVFFFLGYIPF